MPETKPVKPIVAIIGRPNVGKSTFFNRITRTTDAIMDNSPGVTRDRRYGQARWEEVEFTLVDTGGFADRDEDAFAEEVHFQIALALQDADVIVHILDGKDGVSPFDRDILDTIRSKGKPIFFVVNKIDGMEKEGNLYEFYSLGIDPLYPVSAANGYGIGDFLDDLIQVLPKQVFPSSPDMIRVSVVGRPNVGKSSLINRILGEKRLIVSHIPGTTRDAIDSVCKINGKTFLIADTAGIRRKGKVNKRLEKFSVIKALRSLDRCDVALVVIDAYDGITDQDITIAGYAFEKGCGCMLLLNKWDLVQQDPKTAKRYRDQLRHEARFLSFAPILTVSAMTGLRIRKIFQRAAEVYEQCATRIETGKLNKILRQAVEHNEPPFHKRNRRIKFYYATQISTLPPTIVCFVNYPDEVHFSYKRYLINQIREQTGLNNAPIRVLFSQRKRRLQFGDRGPETSPRSKRT